MAKAISAKVVGIRALRTRIGRQKLRPFTKAMHRRLTVIFRDAGDAFIRAAIRQVLVETGMSAASFFPLSRAIKRAGAGKAIRLHIGKPKTRAGIATFPSGKRIPETQRTIAAGKSAGEDAFIFTVGTPTRPVFTFQFVTTVFQLAFHEPSQKALDTGLSAFNEAIKERLLRTAALTINEFLSLKPRTKRIVEP